MEDRIKALEADRDDLVEICANLTKAVDGLIATIEAHTVQIGVLALAVRNTERAR